MVFQKTTCRLLLRVSLKKMEWYSDCKKNLRARSGLAETSIGSKRRIITRALLIARKAAEDPWPWWHADVDTVTRLEARFRTGVFHYCKL